MLALLGTTRWKEREECFSALAPVVYYLLFSFYPAACRLEGWMRKKRRLILPILRRVCQPPPGFHGVEDDVAILRSECFLRLLEPLFCCGYWRIFCCAGACTRQEGMIQACRLFFTLIRLH